MHKVTLSQGYWLADSTVTQEQWQALMGENPSFFEGNKRPVEQVSWDDCQDFINQLNKDLPNILFQLPSDAQWEYACRAGTTTPFSFGANIASDQANYFSYSSKGEHRKITVPIKSLPCNKWGLYEMHGNVWEWCSDSWVGHLGRKPVIDPVHDEVGSERVVRGGSWNSYKRNLHSGYRGKDLSTHRGNDLGLRLSFANPSAKPNLYEQAIAKDGQRVKLLISYSYLDKKYKNSLVKRLDAIGNTLPLKYWSDEALAGTSIFDSFLEAPDSDSADIFILLLSRESYVSRYFQSTLDDFLNRNDTKRIILIKIDEYESLNDTVLTNYNLLPFDQGALDNWANPKLFWDQIEIELTPILKRALVNLSANSMTERSP